MADFAQGVLICAALGVLYFTLPYLGQPEELMPLMRPYLLIQICSLPFLATSNAFKQFVDCINDTMVSMTIMLIGNAWNIFFNWVMIFGHLGCPEMGIEGAAWATLSSRVVIFLLFILVFCCRKKYKKYSSQWSTCKASHADVLTLNKLGWPIAFQMGIETASFSLTAIFLGWIGTTALAANQVMLNIANVIFMFYVGISSAVSIRVSNYNGLHDVTGVRHAAFGGYQMAVTLGIVLTIAAVSFSKNISALFTDSTEVATIVSSLVLPLVLYQFGDGMQTTFANALRGLGDVKKLMKYSTIAYIIISLPLSYIFGIVLEWGTFGVWMGYPFGLTTAALLYFTRFLKITKNTQPIE